jgi:hypothetical protein
VDFSWKHHNAATNVVIFTALPSASHKEIRLGWTRLIYHAAEQNNNKHFKNL